MLKVAARLRNLLALHSLAAMSNEEGTQILGISGMRLASRAVQYADACKCQEYLGFECYTQ